MMGMLKDHMGLQDWQVSLSFDQNEGQILGSCKPDPGYNKAAINIDLGQHDDADEVYTTLVHELCHAIMGYFETYRKAVSQLMDDKVFYALDEFFKVAHEDSVRRIESIVLQNAPTLVEHELTVAKEYIDKEKSNI